MVDLTFLRDFTKGDSSKMKHYIGLYLSEAEKTFSGMLTAMNQQHWPQVKVFAHSLKPQAEMMGLHTLKATLMEIEQAATNGDAGEIPALVNRAEAQHNEAASILREHK